MAILFPAYAGVILCQSIQASYKRAFPRLRGGDPCLCYLYLTHSPFSPPTRG